MKEGLYEHTLTKKEFTVTKSDKLYKLVSVDKSNIKYKTKMELKTWYKFVSNGK